MKNDCRFLQGDFYVQGGSKNGKNLVTIMPHLDVMKTDLSSYLELSYKYPLVFLTIHVKRAFFVRHYHRTYTDEH